MEENNLYKHICVTFISVYPLPSLTPRGKELEQSSRFTGQERGYYLNKAKNSRLGFYPFVSCLKTSSRLLSCLFKDSTIRLFLTAKLNSEGLISSSFSDSISHILFLTIFTLLTFEISSSDDIVVSLSNSTCIICLGRLIFE
jgi:hypothetical protein